MVSTAIFMGDRTLIVRRSSKEEFLSGYWTGIGGKLEDGDLSVRLEQFVKQKKKQI